MPGPSAADYKVELVNADGSPDMTVTVIGDQVVSLVGASPGDVLTVQPDGTVAPAAPGIPGAHASTHAAAGSDPVTLATSQITGLDTALAMFVTKSLYDANTILIANVDDTPLALAVGASTIIGRKAAGGIGALTPAETKTILAIAESDVTNLTTDLGLKAPLASPSFTGTVTLGEGVNLDLGTVTGSKIGTSTSEKLGFYGTTPTAQIAGATDVLAGLVTQGLRAASSNPPLNLGTGALTAGTTSVGALTSTSIAGTGTVALTGALTVTDAVNFAVGSTTGTKIGTATSQKLGFFNATPVVQEAGTNDVLASLVTLGLRAASSNPPLNLGTGTFTCGSMSQTPTATGSKHFLLNAPSGQSVDIFDVQLNGSTKLKVVAGGGITLSSTVTLADTINIALNTGTGSKIGTATTQKLGFFNATPVVQQAAITAPAATAATNVAPFGYSQAQADAIVTAVRALVTEIQALGLTA